VELYAIGCACFSLPVKATSKNLELYLSSDILCAVIGHPLQVSVSQLSVISQNKEFSF